MNLERRQLVSIVKLLVSLLQINNTRKFRIYIHKISLENCSTRQGNNLVV